MGAWIETPNCGVGRTPRKVASYVGAWIETLIRSLVGGAKYVSHPMWVRGLKRDKTTEQLVDYLVASYVGAWIETCFECRQVKRNECRILCGCVD